MEAGKVNWFKLTLSVAGSLILGLSGGIFTSQGVGSWYPGLVKAWFNPPPWVFGPVWTILFILIGIAFYRVWLKGFKGERGRKALLAFIAQFILNLAWSGIFFGLRLFWPAFLEIIILWLAIFWTIKSFYKIDRPAGYLLWPYLIWVAFASVLNLTIAVLN